MNKMTIIGIH